MLGIRNEKRSYKNGFLVFVFGGFIFWLGSSGGCEIYIRERFRDDYLIGGIGR